MNIYAKIIGCLMPLALYGNNPESLLYNLETSTSLIRSLITNNQIHTLFDEQEHASTIDNFINNYSPAEIAFELEVIQAVHPVVLYIFGDTNKDHSATLSYLEQLAYAYHNKIKFITINATQFFVLTQKAGINSLPAFICFKNQKECARIEQSNYRQPLEKLLSTL